MYQFKACAVDCFTATLVFFRGSLISAWTLLVIPPLGYSVYCLILSLRRRDQTVRLDTSVYLPLSLDSGKLAEVGPGAQATIKVPGNNNRYRGGQVFFPLSREWGTSCQ